MTQTMPPLNESLPLETEPEPDKKVKLDLSKMRTDTAVLYSIGRTMTSAAAFCAAKACAKLGTTPFDHQSAYWSLSLSLTMRSAMKAKGCEFIVTADGDSVFTWEHVAYLWSLMHVYPEADAIAALQQKRDSVSLLMRPDGRRGPSEELVSVDLAHFGLTIFRVAAMREVPEPWFLRLPDPAKPGDTIDDDCYFWRHWIDCERTAFVAPGCPIGHVDEFVIWPGANGRPIIQSWANFNCGDGQRPPGTQRAAWEPPPKIDIRTSAVDRSPALQI